MPYLFFSYKTWFIKIMFGSDIALILVTIGVEVFYFSFLFSYRKLSIEVIETLSRS